MASALRRAVGATAAGMLLAVAVPASAQVGRVTGVVRDEGGTALRGATVTAENRAAAPSTYTVSTDDRGRFSILGLRAGTWILTAEAPGFAPSQSATQVQTIGRSTNIEFRLARGAVAPAEGVLVAVDASELQTDLDRAEALFAGEDYGAAIDAYRVVLSQAPALTSVSIQIGHAHLARGEFDQAVAAYENVLKADPANERARVAIARAYADRGDLDAAAATLEAALEDARTGRDVFLALGEIRLAMREPADARRWFERASEADPLWGRPLWRLAEVAMDEGDRDTAEQLMARIITVDPASTEAGQARSALEQLRRN